MNLFHRSVVRPLLDAVDARAVLEVGADQGGHTVQLQEYCAGVGGRLTVVDPGPLSESLLDLLDDRVTTVRLQSSLDALPTLPTPDIALVDGDHNYYTVREELNRLAARARHDGRGLPVTLVHDVGWPYGRRDMYYELARVPEEHRHPCDDRGLAPDVAGKVDGGLGFNAGFLSATVEGGPRNGVLTAVEDFVSDDPQRRLVVLPVLHGLAIVTTDEHPPAVHGILAEFEDSPHVQALLADTERRRVHAELRARDLAKTNAAVRAELAAAVAERDDLRQRSAEAEAALARIRSHPVLRAARPARRLLAGVVRAVARTRGGPANPADPDPRADGPRGQEEPP